MNGAVALPTFLAMFDNHVGVNAAANVEVGRHSHKARVERSYQIVEHLGGHRLVECAVFTVRPEVEREGFQLNAPRIRDVLDVDGGEIRLVGLWTQTRKFRRVNPNDNVAIRVGVAEGFEVSRRSRAGRFDDLVGHPILLHKGAVALSRQASFW